MKSLKDQLKEILSSQDIQHAQMYAEILYANCLAELNQE